MVRMVTITDASLGVCMLLCDTSVCYVARVMQIEGDEYRCGRRRVLRGIGAWAAATCGFQAGASRAQEPEDRPRRIWLRLLLDHVEQTVGAGKKVTEEERYLAGLTSIRYTYLDVEGKDLILEGPAEDRWEVRADGMAVGAVSGSPLLQLDDFAVAWRNAVSQSPPPSVSLEHRPDSIQRIQELIRNTPQPKTPEARADYLKLLQESWGAQDAVTGGVPKNTRFNQVMVEADWEMKRLSLGLSPTAPEALPTYVDLEFKDWRRRVMADGIRTRRPEGGSRFWFYPAYTEFAHSEKRDAVEIPKDAVQLLTESHFRTLAQGRQVAQEPSQTAKEFVKSFTEQYQALSRMNPIFADLRSLFDWVAISRLIQALDVPRRIGWDFAYLGQGYPVAEIAVPSTKPGQVALRHAQVQTTQGIASLVLPARGGVSIDVRPNWESPRKDGRVDLARRSTHAKLRRPAPGRFYS